MGKQLLIAAIVLILSMVRPSFCDNTSAAGLIDRPQNMDAPSKNETGILGTMVLIYTKTRDAVKDAYNEVMYFKEMYNNYQQMKNWLKRAQTRTTNIWDKASDLFTDPKNVFVTLDRLVDIFDNIDYAVWAVPNELDHILAKTEFTYDKIVDGIPSGGMLPNTDEAIEYVDYKFGLNRLPPDTNDPVNGKYVAQLAAAKANGQQFPEEDMVTASRLIASSAMANAEMYRNWALQASQNIPNTEKNFASVQGANGNSLAACWYAIEQTNANNKLLANHLNELKVYQAMLGIYVYEVSDQRTQELQFKNAFNSASMYANQAIQSRK